MPTLKVVGAGVVTKLDSRKPPFTVDQIVSGSDMVRQWRVKVKPRLTQFPYVIVFSGADPRTTIMPYEKFERMWQRAEEASELELKLEVLARTLHLALTGRSPVPLAEVVEALGITQEDLEGAGDVELETDD